MKKCQTCKKEYRLNKNYSKAQKERSKFCSYVCLYSQKGNKWMGKSTVIKRNCIVCSGEFTKRKHEAQLGFENRVYCSHSCYLLSHAKPCTAFKLCEACGSLFSRRKGENYTYYETRKFCNIDCYAMKVGRNHGDKNPSWKGGMSTFSQKLRNTSKYREWRDCVLSNDNQTCVWCKSKNKLQADHIIPFFYFLENIRNNFKEKDWFSVALKYEPLWDVKNGRTLCIECHKKTDTYMYKAKNFQITA